MAILNAVIAFMMTLDIIAIPLGVLAAVILGIQARRMTDAAAKKSNARLAWLAFLGPIGLLLILIIVYGLARLLANTFAGN